MEKSFATWRLLFDFSPLAQETFCRDSANTFAKFDFALCYQPEPLSLRHGAVSTAYRQRSSGVSNGTPPSRFITHRERWRIRQSSEVDEGRVCFGAASLDVEAVDSWKTAPKGIAGKSDPGFATGKVTSNFVIDYLSSGFRLRMSRPGRQNDKNWADPHGRGKAFFCAPLSIKIVVNQDRCHNGWPKRFALLAAGASDARGFSPKGQASP